MKTSNIATQENPLAISPEFFDNGSDDSMAIKQSMKTLAAAGFVASVGAKGDIGERDYFVFVYRSEDVSKLNKSQNPRLAAYVRWYYYSGIKRLASKSAHIKSLADVLGDAVNALIKDQAAA